MYICHCRAITDTTIEAAISSGATTVDELARRCGAGSRCGGCWPALEEFLAAHSPSSRPAVGVQHARAAHHAA